MKCLHVHISACTLKFKNTRSCGIQLLLFSDSESLGLGLHFLSSKNPNLIEFLSKNGVPTVPEGDRTVYFSYALSEMITFSFIQ